MVAKRKPVNQRIAALAMHAQHRTLAVSAAGRAAANAVMEARFLQEIDDLARERGEELSEDERQRRLSYRWKEHYARLQYLSAKARQRKARRRDA